MKPVRLGRVLGLDLSAGPSAPPALLLLAGILFAAGYSIFQASVVVATLGALALTILHVTQEIIHQWGHSVAARRVGHPMTGIRLWLILSASEYPDNEPPLPASIHIKRALGGPIVSLIVSVALAPIAWYFWSTDKWLPGGWLVITAFLDSLIFSVGPFVPLGFNDGSSILRALRSR